MRLHVRMIVAFWGVVLSSLLSASAYAQPATPRPVSVLDRLDHVDGAVFQRTREGLAITSAPKTPDEARMETTAEFKVPLVITAVAKTDSRNLRFYYGKGRIIFNWEGNPTELRLEEPKNGRFSAHGGQGSVPPNTWVTLRWTITEEQMRIEVDGVQRAMLKGDWVGVSGTVGIGTTQKAVVTVKSLSVAPLPPIAQPKLASVAKPADSGPIDIAVPSGPPGPNSTVPAAAPSDPSVIERPEYRKTPKALVKSLTSVTSMLVTIAEDGQANGSTGDIIAAISGASRDSGKAGIGFVRSDGDSTMRTALEESVRAVTMRYPKWEPGHIDLSFGEKFVLHGGPSAGVAFALLQLSCLEGFDIDTKCAVTGDITVDWKVRRVGGVTAKIRGATLDKCLYALIPEDNATAFTDMGLLYGPSAWWGIQVFSIATLQQAMDLARVDRKRDTAQAIKLFADLQLKLEKSEQATLRDPQTMQILQQVLKLAPNHLSAQNLLTLYQGTAPKTLSSNATIYQLSVAFYPYRRLLSGDQAVDRTTLPAYVTVQTRKHLNALRPIAHADLRPLLADIAAFVEAMDSWAGRPSTGSAKALLDRATKLDGRIAALDNDPNFYEKLIREGY